MKKQSVVLQDIPDYLEPYDTGPEARAKRQLVTLDRAYHQQIKGQGRVPEDFVERYRSASQTLGNQARLTPTLELAPEHAGVVLEGNQTSNFVCPDNGPRREIAVGDTLFVGGREAGQVVRVSDNSIEFSVPGVAHNLVVNESVNDFTRRRVNEQRELRQRTLPNPITDVDLSRDNEPVVVEVRHTPPSPSMPTVINTEDGSARSMTPREVLTGVIEEVIAANTPRAANSINAINNYTRSRLVEEGVARRILLGEAQPLQQSVPLGNDLIQELQAEDEAALSVPVTNPVGSGDFNHLQGVMAGVDKYHKSRMQTFDTGGVARPFRKQKVLVQSSEESESG